jgi:hypothetical protein
MEEEIAMQKGRSRDQTLRATGTSPVGGTRQWNIVALDVVSTCCSKVRYVV